MKKPLTSLLLTTIAMFIIFSCTKDSGSGNNNGSGGNGGGGGATTGQVIFWTSSDFGCGNITVVCNGISRQITGYYSSGTPDCGDTYGANFTLNPGSYNFTATCSGGNSWSGNITITAGICSKMQLTGGTGGGGGTGISAMFWASDLGCGPITVNFYGQQKQITASSTSAPSCGTNGFATFDNLPYIITGYTASCSSLSWSGSVSTTPGTCTKIQLTRANATGGGGGGGGGSNCNWNTATSCVTVTKKTGTRCGDPQSVEITAKNTCNQNIKIYICIQKSDGTWDGVLDGTFSTGVPPNGTAVHYVCKGTGQYKIGAIPISTYNTYNCPWPSCN